MNQEENNFEGIIPKMKEADEHEIMALNGFTNVVQLADLNLEPLELKLQGLQFLKTDLTFMLNNIAPYISKTQYKKLNEKLLMCNSHKPLTKTYFVDINKRKRRTDLLVENFNHILENLREIKMKIYELIIELYSQNGRKQ